MGTVIVLGIMGLAFYGLFVATGVDTNPSGGNATAAGQVTSADSLAGYRPSSPSVGRTPSVTYV